MKRAEEKLEQHVEGGGWGGGMDEEGKRKKFRKERNRKGKQG